MNSEPIRLKTSEGMVITRSAEKVKKMDDAAKVLLGDSNHYLYATDRNRLHAYLSERTFDFKPEYEPEDLEHKVAALKNASIPALWEERFVAYLADGNPFPVIDDLILQGSGGAKEIVSNHGANIAIRVKQGLMIKADRSNLALCIRSTPQMVKDFANTAFDNGDYNPQLLNYLKHRLETSQVAHQNLSRYREVQDEALTFLKAKLSTANFIPENTTYSKIFSPGQKLSFVEAKWPWFLGYNPEDRESIAKTFKEALRTDKKLRDLGAIERIKAIFPQIEFPNSDELRIYDVKQKYDQALSEGRLNAVPAVIFKEDRYADLRKDYASRVQTHLNSLQDKDAILKPIASGVLARAVSIPPDSFSCLEVRETIAAARNRRMREMTDEEFRQRFSNPKALANFGTGDDSVHKYACERYHQLFG